MPRAGGGSWCWPRDCLSPFRSAPSSWGRGGRRRGGFCTEPCCLLVTVFQEKKRGDSGGTWGFLCHGRGRCEPLVWELKQGPMSDAGSGAAPDTLYTGSARWAGVHFRRPDCWPGVRGPVGTTPAPSAGRLLAPSSPGQLQLRLRPLTAPPDLWSPTGSRRSKRARPPGADRSCLCFCSQKTRQGVHTVLRARSSKKPKSAGSADRPPTAKGVRAEVSPRFSFSCRLGRGRTGNQQKTRMRTLRGFPRVTPRNSPSQPAGPPASPARPHLRRQVHSGESPGKRRAPRGRGAGLVLWPPCGLGRSDDSPSPSGLLPKFTDATPLPSVSGLSGARPLSLCRALCRH